MYRSFCYAKESRNRLYVALHHKIKKIPVCKVRVVPRPPPGALDELLDDDVFGRSPQHSSKEGVPANVLDSALLLDVPVEPLGVHVACIVGVALAATAANRGRRR